MKIKTILISLMGTMLMISCDKVIETPDGLWETMKWSTEIKSEKVNVDGHNISAYRIPAEGGTCAFTCTNYTSFWVVSLLEKCDGEEKQHVFHNADPDPTKTECMKGDWCYVSNTKNVLSVDFAPNAGQERYVWVEVTAGDIFCSFAFVQNGSTEEGVPNTKR